MMKMHMIANLKINRKFIQKIKKVTQKKLTRQEDQKHIFNYVRLAKGRNVTLSGSLGSQVLAIRFIRKFWLNNIRYVVEETVR